MQGKRDRGKEDRGRSLPHLCVSVVVGMAMVVGLLSGAWAQGAPEGSEEVVLSEDVVLNEEVVLNFEGADIREVIHSLATALNLNYTIDPRVQGQVTIRTTGKISRHDLFPVFHQILRAHGIAAVKVGALYHIVPVGEAKTKAVLPQTALDSRGMKTEDTFIVELVKVEHITAEEIAKVLQPLVSPGGDVIAYPRGNLLVLTDLASNVDRLKDLIAVFDIDTFRELHAQVYKIEHADPEELALELVGVLEPYGVSAQTATEHGVYILPLARLSSVVVVAFSPMIFPELEKWVKILDVPPEEGGGRTVHVYAVENTKAADLAMVLGDLYGETSSGGGRRGGEGGFDRGVGFGQQRGGGGEAERGGGSSRRGGGSSRRGGGSGFGQRGGGSRSGGRTLARGGGQTVTISPEEGARSIFREEVRIVADEITNSLIVLATARDYARIRDVVEKLDIVPRQVLIEAVIAEVALTDDLHFGVEFAFTNETAGLNRLLGGSAVTAEGGGGGAFADRARQELSTIGGGSLFAAITDKKQFFAVLTALAARSQARVLATPHIIAADNREAHILIGEEIPILSSQAVSVISGDAPIVNSVQYRDTGKILTVLPQVNSKGLVHMEILQEVSDVGQETFGSTNSPSFISREAETTVVVQSGESVIIGGIIDEQIRHTRSGIPFLMDIPVLGRAFRMETDSLIRTEVIVLITPHVIRSREEAQSVTEAFKGRIEGLQEMLEQMRQGRQAPGEAPAGEVILLPED